jgi:transcriptional regulator with XRE-family HTH domain
MVDCILDQIWRQYELDNRVDLKIEEVSEATGIHRDTISRIRHRKTKRFDADVLAKLAEFFGVPEGEPVPFLIVRYIDEDAKKGAAS